MHADMEISNRGFGPEKWINYRAEGALSSSGRIPIVDFCSVRILLSTLLSTFAHTVKKKPSELESELQNT